MITRDQLRSRRRKHAVRARSFSVRRTSQRELEHGRALHPETDYWRPTTRGDCASVPRPCPYVSCQHNLYLDVDRTGTLKLNFPDLEVHEMGESCSLDVADRGDATLEVVGTAMNITRERVRQLEAVIVRKLKPRSKGLREAAADIPLGPNSTKPLRWQIDRGEI